MKQTIRSIRQRATNLLKDKNGLKSLLEGSRKKLVKVEKRSELVRKTETVIRMVKAHISGDYRSFSLSTLSLLVFGLVYFVTPADLIPDIIPALGFSDDLSILVWIFRSLKEDIEHFEEWELSTENN